MNITVQNMTSDDGISKFEKIIQIFQGGRLFDETYRFNADENKCSFEIERYCFEKPVKQSKFLFIFPQYVCGTIRSSIEVCPVMKVTESKNGYEDLEISLSHNKDVLEIGTYQHTFSLTISENTTLKVSDISNEIKVPPSGYFGKKYQGKLNAIINELSS